MNHLDAMDNKHLQTMYLCQTLQNPLETLEKLLKPSRLQDKDRILFSLTTLIDVLMDHTGSTRKQRKAERIFSFTNKEDVKADKLLFAFEKFQSLYCNRFVFF